MSVMQCPTEEDYWKAGQSDAIVYPNFKIWMSHNRFMFILKNLCLSGYTISRADIAQDKLWKVQRRCYNRQSQVSMKCKSTMHSCVKVKANQERLDSL
eukprot:11979849-Ditylum_brightwellii.AAC.1